MFSSLKAKYGLVVFIASTFIVCMNKAPEVLELMRITETQRYCHLPYASSRSSQYIRSVHDIKVSFYFYIYNVNRNCLRVEPKYNMADNRPPCAIFLLASTALACHWHLCVC